MVRRNRSRWYRDRSILGPERTHGLRSTYNAGCRCDECTDAESEYSREYKRVRRQL